MLSIISIETILIVIIIDFVMCNQKPEDSSKKQSHYVRMQMEEITDEELFTRVPKDKSSDNIVSFLVENVKELFLDMDNSTVKVRAGGASIKGLLDSFKTTTKHFSITPDSASKLQKIKTNDIALSFLLHRSNQNVPMPNNDKIDSLLLSSLKNIESKIERSQASNFSQSGRFSVIKVTNDTEAFKKSCIACDNVMIEECNDPKYKLVPSRICERTDDLCYSQHTPFGIIDRGCFNVNHNMTLYVCACNLCNYISISEMPYMFPNKRDWIENVIELSRAKRFRDSVAKYMSCLKCEVNVTDITRDRVADAHCLEGNVAMLPIQVCGPDEICTIRAIRREGYMWRGCSDEHLYNYWFTLCDSDLCNYDSIVSIYDTV